MINQGLNFKDDQKVSVAIDSIHTRIEVTNVFGSKTTIYLDVKEMEELTDLMMDCFYKAQKMKNQVREEVPMADHLTRDEFESGELFRVPASMGFYFSFEKEKSEADWYGVLYIQLGQSDPKHYFANVDKVDSGGFNYYGGDILSKRFVRERVNFSDLVRVGLRKEVPHD